MILTFTPNPCVDKTIFIEELRLGERLRSSRVTCITGGKGANVARAAKTFGQPVAAMLIVAGPTGAHALDMLKKQDRINCIPVWVEGMTRTITTVLEEPLHRQTAFFEPGPSVSEDDRRQLAIRLGDNARRSKVVTFNGTVPDPAIADIYRDLIPLAKKAGALTVLDTHGAELRHGLEAAPHMVKPNLEEAEEFLGYALDSEDAQRRALDAFHAMGVELVVLSLGARGLLVSRGGERLRVTPDSIQEVNPVGSGDCLVAAFATGLREGWPLDKMAVQGAAAGAANAMSWEIAHFERDFVDLLAGRMRIEAF